MSMESMSQVKMDWPPKDRSRLFLLPDSKRLMCVSRGWCAQLLGSYV